MRYLFVLSIFFLVGCCISGSNDDPRLVLPSELKYKAADEIKVTCGFYSDCIGEIINYRHITYSGKYFYTVKLYCKNMRQSIGDIELEQSILEKIK